MTGRGTDGPVSYSAQQRPRSTTALGEQLPQRQSQPQRQCRPLSRELVVRVARSWIGTPYHHQASLRGTGTDCLGLVRGVYRTLYGREAARVPGYSRDWAEAAREETMLNAAATHLTRIELQEVKFGDVVIFRWRSDLMAKHAAILSAEDKMIHAIEGARVGEVTFCPWWRRHVAGAFSFPGIIE